jgi:hypothetical protein
MWNVAGSSSVDVKGFTFYTYEQFFLCRNANCPASHHSDTGMKKSVDAGTSPVSELRELSPVPECSGTRLSCRNADADAQLWLSPTRVLKGAHMLYQLIGPMISAAALICGAPNLLSPPHPLPPPPAPGP